MRTPTKPTQKPHPDGPMVRIDATHLWLQPGRYTYSESNSSYDPDVATTPYLAWAGQNAVTTTESRANGNEVEYVFEVHPLAKDGPGKKPGVIWANRVHAKELKRVGFGKDLALRGRPTWLPSTVSLPQYWGDVVRPPTWSEILPEFTSPVADDLRSIRNSVLLLGGAGVLSYFLLTRSGIIPPKRARTRRALQYDRKRRK